jgi:hypothetical protein
MPFLVENTTNSKKACAVKWPNFFIIGAFRSGTTSLCAYLSEHPRIYFSPVKETHFFSTDYPDQPRPTLQEYHRLFAARNDFHLAIGEGSTSYLFSDVAVPRILKCNPDARFIVMLRNPIHMAFSNHAHLLFYGVEDVGDFEKAWRLEGERARGRRIPPLCNEWRYLLYSNTCKVGSQLERLYQHVPRERVLIHFFQDFVRDTTQAYERTLAFLGVPSDGRKEFPALNRAKVRRSQGVVRLLGHLHQAKAAMGITRSFGISNALDRINIRQEVRKPRCSEFRRELIEYFTPEIEKIAKLTGRDVSSWLESR